MNPGVHLVAADGRSVAFADDLPATTGAAQARMERLLRSIETFIAPAGPAYPWLRVPVLDPHGEIDHHRGVTRVPGLYVLGLRFLHRRNSSFVDGVGPDARFVTAHLTRRTVSRACLTARGR